MAISERISTMIDAPTIEQPAPQASQEAPDGVSDGIPTSDTAPAPETPVAPSQTPPRGDDGEALGTEQLMKAFEALGVTEEMIRNALAPAPEPKAADPRNNPDNRIPANTVSDEDIKATSDDAATDTSNTTEETPPPTDKGMGSVNKPQATTPVPMKEGQQYRAYVESKSYV